jgi:outer membrane protein TolC
MSPFRLAERPRSGAPRLAHPLWTAAAVVLLAGCATLPGAAVDDALADAGRRTGAAPRFNLDPSQRDAARAEADRLLAQPLSADDAVRIALAASPALQALIAERAAETAAAARSGLPMNPVFTFERLVRREGGSTDLDIGRMLSFGLVDLLSWPVRSDIAQARTQEIRLRLAGDVVAAAAEVRSAWVQAVAAQQAAQYFADVRDSADASNELARRMMSAGNFSKLQRAREQVFLADAVAQLARARHAQVATRERLVRLLGLEPERAARLTLPGRLPDVPAQPRSEPDVTRQALDTRLDVLLARAELDATARRHGLTRVTSWVDGLHLGVVRNSETGRPPQKGFEIELPLPVFDGGSGARAEARAAYVAALNRTAQVAVDAHSSVAEAWHAYRTSLELARHYRDEIVPLRQQIAEENTLRYNAMLIGVFELLAGARDQVGSVIAALEAQRDFWLADAALQAAIVGRPPATAPALAPGRAAAATGGGEGH